MLNILSTRTTSGSSVYAIIRNSSLQVWSTSSSSFVSWADANYAQYVVALTEQGTSGFYSTNLPSAITIADTLIVEYWQGSGTENDLFIAGGQDTTFNSSGSALALTSLAYVKDYGQITTTTWDVFLTNRIFAVSALIQSYCNRTFPVQTYTEDYDGPGSTTLLLHQWPVQAVSQVILDQYYPLPTTLGSSDIVVNANKGIISVSPSSVGQKWFGYGDQNIQVTYTAGYSTIPNDIQEAAAAMVLLAYAKMAGGNYTDLTVSQEKIGDYQRVSRADAQSLLTDDVKQTLNHYKQSFI